MSILHQEIQQQPDVIRNLIENETGRISELARKTRGRFSYVLIAARGTSDNAARYAQYLFGAHNRLPVALATPSLFTLYQRPPVLEGALVIGISQSGQSPDIVEVVAEARRQGRPTIAITNQTGSPLALAAEDLVSLNTGPERAIAATKTYTASLAALALFSAVLAGDTGHLQALRRLPDAMRQALQDLEPLIERAERYRYMAHCAVIGRGFNYSTAFEIALKIKELTRVVAEPYSSADFRHGPVAMVRDGFPVIVIAPAGAVSGDMRALLEDLRTREAELLVISEDPAALERAQLAFRLPGGLPEWLTPPLAVLPGQLFALALAEAKGLDPDRPEGITKVTETT